MRPTAEATYWHITNIFLLVSFHNVLAWQDETKIFLPSFFLSFHFFFSSYPHSLRLPLQFQFCFTCHQIACPINEAPRISRCVPQGIRERNYVYAPGTTASTGKSSLCSSHPDDFLFKIHLGGSCVTLFSTQLCITAGHLEDCESCWLWGWGKGKYSWVMVHQL